MGALCAHATVASDIELHYTEHARGWAGPIRRELACDPKAFGSPVPTRSTKTPRRKRDQRRQKRTAPIKTRGLKKAVGLTWLLLGLVIGVSPASKNLLLGAQFIQGSMRMSRLFLKVRDPSVYGNAVPAFDFTSPISAALMEPLTFTSVRKLDGCAV